MIKPTVGRVVLIQRTASGSPDPEPALITKVLDDHTIHVAGFTDYGTVFAINPCSLIQEGEPKPEGQDFAYWMPYQIGQAAKESTPAVAAKVVDTVPPAPPVAAA